MRKIFKNLGGFIEKTPVKVLLISILTVVLMLIGTSQIKMATGNETLVDKNNEVFITNEEMEKNFGSEAILILFNGDIDDLLSADSINKMWNVSEQLKHEETLFTIMSIAEIVNQISTKQFSEIKNKASDFSTGLNSISLNLINIASNLTNNQFGEIEDKLNSFSENLENFTSIINGISNLETGLNNVNIGLAELKTGLDQIILNLEQLSNTISDQQLKEQLLTVVSGLKESVSGLSNANNGMENFVTASTQLKAALQFIKDNLSNEIDNIKEIFETGISPEYLTILSQGLIEMGKNLAMMSNGLNEFIKKSTSLKVTVPSDQNEINFILYDNGEIRTIFKELLIDESHALMTIKLNGNLDDQAKEDIVNKVILIIEKENFENLNITISGKPVLDIALKSEMQSNMILMVALAVIIMFIILFIVFKVNYKLLSLGVILVSVIATLGLMGILTVPVTMVSMAVFPILIGLGIDYSIQLHSRYHEELSIKETMHQVGTAILVAVFATALGFISLFISPVPMIKDFGKMLTIGVLIAFLGSIFILLPILHLVYKNKNITKNNNNKTKNKENKKLDLILTKFTKGIIKFSIPILIIFLTLAGVGFSLDRKIEVEIDIESFMPQNMDALDDIHKIRNIIGSTEQVILYIKDDDVLSESNLLLIDELSNLIIGKYDEEIVNIKSINTIIRNTSDNELNYEEKLITIENLPLGQKKMFINKNNSETLIIINIKHLSTSNLQQFISNLNYDLKSYDLNISVTGMSVLDSEMVKGLTDGRIKMTVVGLILVFLALIIIYRNIFKALVPIIPVIIIIGLSSAIMYLLNISFTPITATIGALVLGMGTELTIMFLERYIEERNLGNDKTEAMINTVTTTGKAIFASGLTTIGGFSVLIISKFVILKDFGLMTVINVSLALLSVFIVLPAIIYIFDGLIIKKHKNALNK